jgi:hypothetical protein
MPRNQKLKDVFSKALEQALIARYSKIPSAAFVAKEFNLRALDIDPISQETARKWLRGLGVPKLNKLLILQAWLGIDMHSLNVYLEDKSEDLDNNSFTNKKLFLNKTNSLKKILSAVMNDITDLEKEIAK